MCYSGKCRYEKYTGDCNIPSKLGTDKMPQDADCVQAKYHILEQYLLDDYYNKINGVKGENLIEEVEKFYRKTKGEGYSHE